MSKATKPPEKTTRAPRPPAPLPAGTEALLKASQICAALGIGPRSLRALIAAGQYPKADVRIGPQQTRWTVGAHNAWVTSRRDKGV